MEILIVEDHPLQFHLLRALLAAEGYAICHAATGSAALAVARDRKPGLILLDASLPGISGFEVARQLRCDPLTRRIPIAMVSAAASRCDHEQAAASGCDGFFTKPVDTRTFGAEVAQLIGRCTPPCGG
jgi:CheY-like chemotaxis protein